MRFVVDAGVGTSVERLLRELGYETVAVRAIDPHMPDVEVLALAHQHGAVIITMDKDFGDLIFKEQRPHHGVLLLRLEEATGPERAVAVRLVLAGHAAELAGRFAVFHHERLRISG